MIGFQDERWLRIGQLPSRNPLLAALVRGASAWTRYQQASFVQSTVNGRFVYRSDQDNWGVKDYWASADETIARGAGDCEDLALVKLQALRLLGFNERDLYLMTGTKPSGEEHALLLVRIDERFWVLEDGLSRMVPAESFHMFRPAVTYGAGWKWVHGAQPEIPSAAAASGAPQPLP
jgi:predicted transglutaminase-like cysteine proteinase